MDLNQLANQLATGLAQGQYGDPGEPIKQPPGGAIGVQPDAPSAGATFQNGLIRLGDVLDHALLDSAATAADVDRHCERSLQQRTASVLVHSFWVARCAERLRGSGVAIAGVVGFPSGMIAPSVKAVEAAFVVEHGATEVESVLPLGVIKGGDWRALHDDVAAVVEASGDALVTVILDTARITPMEMLRAAAVAGDAGADGVKTGTGLSHSAGTSLEAVALLRLAVGDDLMVKAGAGAMDAETAFTLLSNGATRIVSTEAMSLSSATGRGPRSLRELMTVASAADAETAGALERDAERPAGDERASAGTASGPNAPHVITPLHAPRVTPGWGTSHPR